MDYLHNADGEKCELTMEQQACIDYSGARTLMVKGVAGAGKSVVLMAAAEKYKEKYGDRAINQVGIFTFQNTLVSATREVLELKEGQESCIYVGTLLSYINKVCERVRTERQEKRKRYPATGDWGKKNSLKNVEEALKLHEQKKGIHHRFYDLPLEFWLEEFIWMKEMNVWTDNEKYYLSLPRQGRGGKVKMRTAERAVAYDIFCTYCEYLEKTGQADWEDEALYLVRHREFIPEDMKFEHILIDEAQDFSLVQMMALLGFYRKDMIIAMDMNQRISGKIWTPKMLGIETTTKKLNKSMRTTRQIESLAEAIRSKNDCWLSEDDKSIRVTPEKDGKMPLLVHLRDRDAEKKYLVHRIAMLQKAYPKSRIGIICAKKNTLTKVGGWLTDANIYHEEIGKEKTFSMRKPGVKLSSAFGAKGLEFDFVFIPLFIEGEFPYRYRVDNPEDLQMFLIKMRNLVYVSMTRAKLYLEITYHGQNGSRFIGEMTPGLYETSGEPMEGSYAIIEDTEEVTGSEGESVENKEVRIPPVVEQKTEPEHSVLVDYLKAHKIEYADKRPKGGALWIEGNPAELEPYIKEMKKLYGVRWIYSPKKGKYFITCDK